MGSLLTLLLGEGDLESYLFDILVSAGCSIRGLAALALASPVATAWVRQRLAIATRAQYTSLLRALENTSCHAFVDRWVTAVDTLRARTALYSYEGTGPVVWFNQQHYSLIAIVRHWKSSYMPSNAEGALLLTVRGAHSSIILAHGGMHFRLFDDVVRYALRPPEPAVLRDDRAFLAQQRLKRANENALHDGERETKRYRPS